MKNILRRITVALLTFEAQLILKKHRPEIIAVTGSVGKTSAKDAIHTALGDGTIRKSKKSQNSDIGVPLTIIGAENQWESVLGWLLVLLTGLRAAFAASYPKALILEVGADHPGDIAQIAAWLRPDVVVMTGVPDIPVHIAFFDSADAVLREKAELVRNMRGGVLILNGDNERALRLKQEYAGKTLTYGMGSGNDIFASHEEPIIAEGRPHQGGGGLLWYRGIRFRVNHGSTSVPFELRGVVGEPHILATLAGTAVALAKGESLAAVSDRFKRHEPPPGRMRLIEGISGATVIDDSYNASPAAALKALDALAMLPVRGRRIAALGDMRELGSQSAEAHELVGRRAAQVADLLITVGEESRMLAESAEEAGLPKARIRCYDYGESKKAGVELANELRPGDIVLVKGSQNMIRMERFVKEIMAEPDRAPELLVRQEKEWLMRS